MKKTIKRLTAYMLTVLMLLPCIVASADSVNSIRWETNGETIALASDPSGVIPSINPSKVNDVEVTFVDGTADQATLMIVPSGAEPIVENAVLLLQAPVTESKASFSFYLKPTTTIGTYAVYVSGTDTAYTVRYFEIGATISWITELGEAVLSSTADGRHSTITSSLLNSVEITYPGGAEGLASLMITPADAEQTVENAVLLLQEPIIDGKASFKFYLKPSTENGVYALWAGATGKGDITKYIGISDNVAPKIVSGQILQYDDYKNNIKIKLKSNAGTDFEEWTAADMRVTISSGGNSVEVEKQHIRFNIEDETMSIATFEGAYDEILPVSPIEGNIQQAEISIVTQGYWGDSEFNGAVKGSFKMVMPEFSADGFKEGVPFEIDVYSDDDLVGANAIVALYDDDSLVDFAQVENIVVSAGETKTIPITMQSENLAESGKFSLKVLLWNGFSAEPLTSFVLFP